MASVLAFGRRHSRWVFAIATVAAIVSGLLVSRITFDANVLRLLPEREPAVADFRVFLQTFGSLDHLYVVFDAPDGIGDHGNLVDRYVDGLRAAPEIESVDARLFEPGKDWSYLSDRVLYLLGPGDATAALERFHPPRIDAELAHARDLLSMPSAAVKTLVQQDPLGLLMVLRDRMGRESGIGAFDPNQDGYVSRDGNSRLVIVKPKGAPFDTDFCKALFARLTMVEATARRQAADDDSEAASVRVQTAGAYRISLEAEQLIRREGIVNAVGSFVLLLLIVFAVFRTPRVLAYGALPLGLAALLTLGLNGVLRGSLSPATSGSAGMLFGLGIDGVILLYLRYLEERASGASTDAALGRMDRAASSVALAQGTTAATFLALLFIDFPTLEEMGSLVGVGILLCCALTLLMVPAMLPRGGAAREGRALDVPWLGRFVHDHAAAIVALGAMATVAFGLTAMRLRVDTSIERLQAQTGGAVLEREIAERFSLPTDVLIAMNENADIQPLLEADGRLRRAVAEQMPSLSASGIGLLLPTAGEQTRVAAAITASAASPAEVERDIEGAAARAGFRAGSFRDFLGRVPRLLDPAARISYDGLLAAGLEPVISRFIAREDGRYRAATYLFPKPGVDIEAVRSLVRSVDPQLRLTGLPVIDHDLRRQFVPQFLKGIGIGTAAVAILIFAVFRSLRDTLLALLPTLVGLIWSAGLLALLRVELDLFSLFAAVTFIGIAVDYGIYPLYRYRVERRGTMQEVMTKTGAAIAIACATALVGFGTLVNSAYRPLHLFGIVSIVTLLSCLIASIVFLPAVVVFVVEGRRDDGVGSRVV